MSGTSFMEELDRANSSFWDTLAGSGLAESIGLTDWSVESLARFDQRYFEYYPYLLGYLNLPRMMGKKVTEVGLGYGSLGQKIAGAGADYLGLDVAGAPLRLMNQRLKLNRLPGLAMRGSMLDCPVKSESQDFVVAIGCFHHTGDVQRCFEECYRILKPSGTAVMMVYNLFSYRRWHRWPWQTMRAWWRGKKWPGEIVRATEEQKLAYDSSDSMGKGAPDTVFLSIRQLRRMLSRFSRVTFAKENCNYFCSSTGIRIPRHGRLTPPGRIDLRVDFFMPRERLLPLLGRTLGLDIYITAHK